MLTKYIHASAKTVRILQTFDPPCHQRGINNQGQGHIKSINTIHASLTLIKSTYVRILKCFRQWSEDIMSTTSLNLPAPFKNGTIMPQNPNKRSSTTTKQYHMELTYQMSSTKYGSVM